MKRPYELSGYGSGYAIGLISCLLVILAIPVKAELINRPNTPMIRFRLGSNIVNQVNTVIYNADIPGAMAGLPGVTAQPEEPSTTPIAGGSGIYEVRIVTDVNSKGNAPNPLTGTFSYDSSTNMTCTTPATCGGESIPFTKIRWETRDGDTLNTVSNYDGSANQVFQVQTDANPNNATVRHRNYYQYIYINDILRPAGTYQGAITVNGSAQ